MRHLSRHIAQWHAWVPDYTADTRLYEIDTPLGKDVLLVESFVGREGLSALYEYRIDCISTDPGLALTSLLWQPAVLRIRLADGTHDRRSGFIAAATRLGAGESIARYRLTVVPWLALARYRHKSKAYQDLSVLGIFEDVLHAYREHGSWRIASDADAFIARVRPRSYCCQYRESDHAFLSRLLAEEGIGFYFEEPEDGHAPAQRLVLFADSPDFPEDRSAAASGGIRFHRNDAAEQEDAIQAFHCERRLQHARTSIATWDYKTRQVISASLESRLAFGGRDAPRTESYDWCGVYAFASHDDAMHYAAILRQAADARAESWHGRGSVRTMRPGTAFGLTGSILELQDLARSSQGTRHRFCITSVFHAGVNNLPAELGKHVEAELGPWTRCNDNAVWPEDEAMREEHPDSDAWHAMVATAKATGYANCFTAIRSDVSWRPVLLDGTGLFLNPKPTANGPQTALVVGADGTSADAGAVHTDSLGRIRIRYHWQSEESHGCWVRAVQMQAGSVHGAQFIPRIGQEVAVQYIDDDIDRPVVVGALHNGQGGIRDDRSAIGRSAIVGSHAPQGQSGESDRGTTPAWHGAAIADGHAGFLSGFKSAALRTDGYRRQSNQLVFDDTRGQLRTTMSSDQGAAKLNLGYLIHQSDNRRGAYRGTGWELRTDAHGAVRAGKGVLVTTYPGMRADGRAVPAGENEAGAVLLKSALDFAQKYNQAAMQWQSVQFAIIEGGALTGEPRQSRLDENTPPMNAMLNALSGKVDAHSGSMTPSDEPIPHCHAPLVCLVGQKGIGCASSDGMHVAAGEAVHLSSGQDAQFAASDELTMHSGQAIGILAGAAGKDGDHAGISVRVGEGDIDLQAQSGTLRFSAKELVRIVSSTEQLDFAAAKSITARTAKGASLHIEAGDIIFSCPGTISIRGAVRNFRGPASNKPVLPKFPQSVCKQCRRNAAAIGAPFSRIQE